MWLETYIRQTYRLNWDMRTYKYVHKICTVEGYTLSDKTLKRGFVVSIKYNIC